MSQENTLLPVSNQEDWDDTFELYDDDTGDPLDLTAVTAVTITLWDDDRRTTVLSGSIGSGITIDDITGGVMSVHFGASTMNGLTGSKTYRVRLSMVNGGATKDLILGSLPVLDGGPT
jgi:hypothetical protein